MRVSGRYITDDLGRVLILRGCNVGGSSKVPSAPPGGTHLRDSLISPAGVSFVGRPFPLEEADAHFDRLKGWGFTFLRLVVTWEALEHEGPGIYDEAYLSYLRKILLIAEEKGISLFIDPHQDVWSRWTGGDGAPAWTLEKLGIDIERLDTAGAALTHQRYGELNKGAPYPRMIWPTNYSRYAAATMFTLFFAGNVYAPETTIDGESAQDWLQERYLACMRHCFRRLKNCKALVGWGTMNEPNAGFIGYSNLEKMENVTVYQGALPYPLDAMAAASGYTRESPVYATGIRGVRMTGKRVLNPEGLSIFREGYECPWKRAGVWTDEGGVPRLLRKDHFAAVNGRAARFTGDFLVPFMRRFIERMREVNPGALIFIEGTPMGEHPAWPEGSPGGVVNAFHWYDGPTLFTKFFRPWFNVIVETSKPVLGRKNVAALFARAIGKGVAWAGEHMGDMPCLLGEFGLPFDMNGRKAYKTGDYRLHEEALAMYYDGIDANLLGSTIWNYTADNTNEWGDGWNGEDLSIFSKGSDPGLGQGRAMGGWLRPYPMATAGIPLALSWDRKRRLFRYRFRADPRIPAPTEIFIPAGCFASNPAISRWTFPKDGGGSGLKTDYKPEEQRLFIRNEGYEGEAEIILNI
ncbi:MAG: cellulase family glycosylhydrolase [Treponema sp.]|nr:cellulase family glycosylhydrolase [Treponema sp.]